MAVMMKRILTLNTAPQYAETFEALKSRFEQSHQDVQFLIADSIEAFLALHETLDCMMVFLLMNDFTRQELVLVLDSTADSLVVLCSEGLSDNDHYTAYLHGANLCLTHMIHVEIMVSFFESLYQLRQRCVEMIELVACQAPTAPKGRLQLSGGLYIDMVNRLVERDSKAVSLTPMEADLLLLLASHANQVLTHGQIVDKLRRASSEENMDVANVVSRLRKKLGDNAREPKLIKTYYSMGYMLEVARDSQ